MRLSNYQGKCTPKTVAVIGMPRSGSTIVASYINSIDNAMIIGEPFLQSVRARPEGKAWPTIIPTRYGSLTMLREGPVFSEIEKFAAEKFLSISGFKECLTPHVNVLEVVEDLLPRLDHVLITLREPRKNFMSMTQLTPSGHMPMPVEEFNERYISLIDFGFRRTSKIQFVLLDYFRIDPKLEISDATGWCLWDEHSFKMYSGGGDVTARTSQLVNRVDQRPPYAGDDILPSVDAYERVYVSMIFDKVIHGERIIP